jgi:hypothetical protein
MIEKMSGSEGDDATGGWRNKIVRSFVIITPQQVVLG